MQTSPCTWCDDSKSQLVVFLDKKISGWATCNCLIWIFFPLLPHTKHIALNWRSASHFLGTAIFLCYRIQHVQGAVGWFCWTHFKPSPGQLQIFLLCRNSHSSLGFLCSVAGAVGAVCSLQEQTELWTRSPRQGRAVKDPLSIRSEKVKFNLTGKHWHLRPALQKAAHWLLNDLMHSCRSIFCPVLGCLTKSWGADKIWGCFEGALELVTKAHRQQRAAPGSWVKKESWERGNYLSLESERFLPSNNKIGIFTLQSSTLEWSINTINTIKITRKKKNVFPRIDSDFKWFPQLLLLISPYSFIFKDLRHLASTF